MKSRLYLDDRRVKDGRPALVKIAINVRSVDAYISTDIAVPADAWDKASRTVLPSYPSAAIVNRLLAEKKLKVDNAIYRLAELGELHGLTSAQICRRVQAYLNPSEQDNRTLFMKRFDAYAKAQRNEGTRVCYEGTAKKIREFTKAADKLTFEDITREWLKRFDDFLSLTSPSQNARNIKLRNIRTVFNEALKDEIITCYPFRTYKIRPVPTKSRALSAQQLRTLFNYPCEVHQAEAVDMFKLIFLLGGINPVDLIHAKTLKDGRIEYARTKSGQITSLVVLPEAMEIIERYRGKKYLLNIMEQYDGNYKSYLHTMNERLKRIGLKQQSGKKSVGEPLFPDLSSYWARYSVASVGAELDIPRETIAFFLAHSTNRTVTDIYIRINMEKKADAAIRKIADYVLYDK